VAIGYNHLLDHKIKEMPIETLSDDGLIFLWTINARYYEAS